MLTSTERKYTIEWMPELLRLCMEVQDHADKLHDAKVAIQSKATELEKIIEVITEIDKDLYKLNDDIKLRQTELNKAKATYEVFREKTMLQMMDRAREGKTIDTAEASTLIKMEIEINLILEQLTYSEKAEAELKLKKRKAEENGKIGYTSSDELNTLSTATKEANKHYKEIVQLLSKLSIDAQGISELFPHNALNQFSNAINNATHWTNETEKIITIKDHTKSLEESHNIGVIDSSVLFSEVCIALASSIKSDKIDIPIQVPYIGNLTEY